ncbi:C3 and PZP-like alpha-2-macroglobulin domain-containing 8 [Pelobates cultripes]|uniref:C3 and PZP-like alpha-2-macroglobulin domain-containing 8 n=1 Tax=Pelobates cultripes TaxID=61616 RepID=A0AAD1W5Y3_PELCU|nr:C3 and PZP-like alpha-2-macroglobulin domain-containing 8 [Pelobates cultripes]
MQELNTEKTKRMLHKLRANVYHNSGKATKYLAARLRNKCSSSKIAHVVGGDGLKKVTPMDISQEFAHFYSKLYNLKEEGSTHNASLDDITQFLTQANLPQITSAQAEALIRPIELTEVLETIAKLPQGKSPGADGLPNAYYKKFAHVLGPHLLKVYPLPPLKDIPPQLALLIRVWDTHRRKLTSRCPLSPATPTAALTYCIPTFYAKPWQEKGLQHLGQFHANSKLLDFHTLHSLHGVPLTSQFSYRQLHSFLHKQATQVPPSQTATDQLTTWEKMCINKKLPPLYLTKLKLPLDPLTYLLLHTPPHTPKYLQKLIFHTTLTAQRLIARAWKSPTTPKIQNVLSEIAEQRLYERCFTNICPPTPFEATRFYNASESSPLSRELCDGTTCNEVESSTSHWTGYAPSGSCNGAFSCREENHFERCMCYRDCGYDGDPVCGSDGVIYQNQCQMEVTACRNNTRIEQVAMTQCTMEENISEEESDIATVKEQEPPQETTEEEVPVHQSEVSYYSYEYDVDPYTSDNEDGLEIGTELTTAASSVEEAVKLNTSATIEW